MEHATCTRAHTERVPCHVAARKGLDSKQLHGTGFESASSMRSERVCLASVPYAIRQPERAQMPTDCMPSALVLQVSWVLHDRQ